MNKVKNGFTMAEVLIVIAIIAVLSSLTFVNVIQYQRSMAQLEYDGIAKEIFIAAQNHLIAVDGQGYLGLDSSKLGNAESTVSKIYYFAYSPINSSANKFQANPQQYTLLDLMLPFASIDETVRLGGSYIIRYQASPARVLDVFFSPVNGQFSCDLSGKTYTDIRDLSGDDKKTRRRNFDGSVIGWYGGEAAEGKTRGTLEAPGLEVINAEQLYVKVTDNNVGVPNYKTKLLITGVTSTAKKVIELSSTALRVDPSRGSATNVYYVILDDITKSGWHFSELTPDSGAVSFFPGENVKIQALASSTSDTEIRPDAYAVGVTQDDGEIHNSIFDDATFKNATEFDTAIISNIRHLENLDHRISSLYYDGRAGNATVIRINKALQKEDLNWETDDHGFWNTKSITGEGIASENGYYMPISPVYAINYDGQNHSITKVKAKGTENSGLFGATIANSEIKNLELVDFSINGSKNAGALAGLLTGTNVTNVVAYHTAQQAPDATKIEAVTPATPATPTTPTNEDVSAGGLIGIMNGGSINACAASLLVSGKSYAGGLIGKVVSGNIGNCYSGGHTTNGKYDITSYNVTSPAGVAGGLIGDAGSGEISHCYSTCSVSGMTVAGGFAGTATGIITNCYCTGLVKGTDDHTIKYAFIGSGLPGEGSSDNHYYEIINETTDQHNPYMLPYQNYTPLQTGIISQIDATASAYNGFVGAPATWQTARAYDSNLVTYYKGKYSLKTVYQLNATLSGNYFVKNHYGDWPAPEIFVLNTLTS